jgi:hypothetical protein
MEVCWCRRCCADASGEFLLLLAAGCVTPVMHQYLSSSLGEAGLRRLARGIDTGAGRLHAFLLDQLLPRLRLTTYVLAELRGAAATPSAALPELNLPAALFRQLELLAVVLQLRTEQLRLGVVQVAGQYRAFFGWLLGVLRAVEASSSDAGGAGGVSGRAAGEVGSLERLQDVTAFLRGQFLRDGVGAQLQVGGVKPAQVGLHMGMVSPCEQSCTSSTSCDAAGRAAALACT